MPRARISQLSLALVGLAALLGVWLLLATRYTVEQLPGPLQVARAWLELLREGGLLAHIRISLARFGAAYALALLAALPLGLVLGWSTRGLQALNPAIQVLRPISPIAWFPLAVLWFGVGNAPAVFIIFLSAFFPMLLATVSGVRDVPPGYLRVAANFGTRRLRLFRSVILPAAFPTIVVGMRIAVGTAWIHLVAGEMLGAQTGLGFLIVDARNFLRTDQILAGMLTIGLLGLAIDRLMSAGERRLRRIWGAEGSA